MHDVLTSIDTAASQTLRDEPVSRARAADFAHTPDRLFRLGRKASHLADEYGALQRSILDLCGELPADVLMRSDVARVIKRIQETSRYAGSVAERLLTAPAARRIETESLDAEGMVNAAHDAVRHVLGTRVHLHTQIARCKPLIRARHDDMELVFVSLLLLSAAAMPTGGRIHLFVGPDAWAHTRPKEMTGRTYVRLRLVDNGGAWAHELRADVLQMEESRRETLVALRDAVERSGGHLTCAKSRESGNTVELLLPTPTR